MTTNTIERYVGNSRVIKSSSVHLSPEDFLITKRYLDSIRCIDDPSKQTNMEGEVIASIKKSKAKKMKIEQIKDDFGKYDYGWEKEASRSYVETQLRKGINYMVGLLAIVMIGPINKLDRLMEDA